MPDIDYIELQPTEDPTRVKSLVSAHKKSGQAYNLLGQKVNSAKVRGIVVQDGKKYSY